MLLELKAFVQESVQALEDPQLRILADTLRVDLRGCDDRQDIERILTGLLCLDQDTALGTFVTWLRTRAQHEQSQQQRGLLAKKSGFANTFLPLSSPRLHRAALTVGKGPPVSTGATLTEGSNNHSPECIKDHHLTAEIAQRLEEIELLEHDFKDAERHVHSGSPSFDKLKAFLVKLTRLRQKEEETRRFFIQQSQLLTSQHAQMREETLHTREQLDFFVEGFANLRRRHDELLARATEMKAENEVAQECFLSMSANESHFAEILHRTLLHQLEEKSVLTNQLEEAREQICKLEQRQQELQQIISRLKQERGDALKSASCYKLQLRRHKQRLDRMPVDGPDCSFFREQAKQMRQNMSTLLTLFRDSIARDVKSPKQSLSKEMLRLIQRILAPPALTTTSEDHNFVRAVTQSTPTTSLTSVARVIIKSDEARKDLDEVVRGIAFLGGSAGEAESCAKMLSSRMRYLSVNVPVVLSSLQQEAQNRRQKVNQETETQSELSTSIPAVLAQSPDANLSLTIESYLDEIGAWLDTEIQQKGMRGIVLFNAELTARDVRMLESRGYPLDCIFELKTAPQPPPKTIVPTSASVSVSSTMMTSIKPTPAHKTPATPVRSQAAAVSSASSKSPAKPTTPASNNNASRQQSRQSPARSPEQKKPTTAAGSTQAVAPLGSATGVRNPLLQNLAKNTKLDRKAVFGSIPHILTSLEPTTFIEDRMGQVMDVLTRLRDKKAAPFVRWDENTQQVNESLAMWAEDVHMQLWVEQENRQPKKPGDSITPGSAARSGNPPGTATSTAGSSMSSRGNTSGGSSQSTSRTSKGKPSPSKPPSPSRSTSPARGAPSPPKATSTTAKRQATPASPPKKPTSPVRAPDKKSSGDPKVPSVASPGKRRS